MQELGRRPLPHPREREGMQEGRPCLVCREGMRLGMGLQWASVSPSVTNWGSATHPGTPSALEVSIPTRQDGKSGAVWRFRFSLGGMLGLMTHKDMAEWRGSPLGGLHAEARLLPRPTGISAGLSEGPTPHLHALVPPESVLGSLGPGGLPEGNTLLR